jgi:hypothetical protein
MTKVQLDQDSKDRLRRIADLLREVEAEEVKSGTTLNSINTRLDSYARVPNLMRTSGSGTIAERVYSFSVYNAGTNDGVILGEILKPKETLNFGAGAMNNYYVAGTISYDGTGTELVIIYNS